MSRVEEAWMRITRESRYILRVRNSNFSDKDPDSLQKEQVAMIGVGAILGATLSDLKTGDTLELRLFLHRRGKDYD